MKELNGLTVMPQSFYAVIEGGKAVMLPAEDGQWLNKTAVAESFQELEQRAEAAEAKLAELEKQEPVGYHRGEARAVFRVWPYADGDICVPVYARPVPAINLAELVPDEALRELDGVIDWIKGLPIPTNSATKWLIKMSDLRDATLRNIEEKSK